ncbi:variable surface lipoprotein [Metamycoplasma auris]|uniref:Variable surface lipoprotein n=1 Tax=Metamycoplasma auris TaxID=51363 RepID=A0A2W7G4N4_9BACT|nr:variable surface lipoprotein [Metamycoplasma auris]PZW01542.1 hypothetical protein BCF89_10162 [Metamycoplasma auris]
MKKLNKFLIALGSVSSLAALPLIAASCDKTKEESKESKDNKNNEGNSNTTTPSTSPSDSSIEQPQSDQPSTSPSTSPKSPVTPKGERESKKYISKPALETVNKPGSSIQIIKFEIGTPSGDIFSEEPGDRTSSDREDRIEDWLYKNKKTIKKQ